MSRRSLAVAVAMIGIGLGSYLGSGGASFTALIPAVFGGAIGVAGLLALRSARPFRLDFVAVGLATICLLGCLPGLLQLVDLLGGEELDRPLSVAAQSATGLLCAAFVLFSLRDLRPAARASGNARRDSQVGRDAA